MKPRLLDLFCCEGGAGMGYHRAGFDVVGVDLNMKTVDGRVISAGLETVYPFEFHEADALEYLAEHGSEFDAVHASPPCQDHSVSAHAHGGPSHGTGWLLDATISAVRQLGIPFVVENVGGAVMGDAMTLCGTSFGLGLHRHRRFITSWFCFAPPCDPSRIRHRGRAAEIFGHHGNTERIRREWDVPWMSQYGIAQSIPPAFTEFLGGLLMEQIEERAA